VLDPVAAWYVSDILADVAPPLNGSPGRIAYKTGTSYGYRDAWSVGYDGKTVIGVWVGRPDGAPVPGMIGRGAAAPILFDAFARTGQSPAPLSPAPKGAIMAATGKLPLPMQRFAPGAVAGDNPQAPRILFPPQGARIERAAAGGKTEPVALKIGGGVEPLTVLVNGMPVAAPAGKRVVFVDPDGPGFVRLTVMDANGLTDSVVVRVQ
jgi:penicillin-binding protein 1C